MNVDEATWKEIVAEVQANINRFSASAKEHGRPDCFRIQLQVDNAGTAWLVAIQEQREIITDKKAIVRKADGTLLPATVKMTNRRNGTVRLRTKKAPKAWDKLAGKSAADIVKGLRFPNFIMVMGITITHEETVHE